MMDEMRVTQTDLQRVILSRSHVMTFHQRGPGALLSITQTVLTLCDSL